MSQIILHHYPLSPFSEKIRIALGIKNASWGSVDIAPAPPRPLLTPLTGGYRRTPVMQIGVDVFCDTNIILPTLDRLHPAPTLYPGPIPSLHQALSFNWERTIWIPIIGAAIGYGTPSEMSAEDALAAAEAAKPMPVTHIKTDDDPLGLKPGTAVTVTSDDNAKVPVSGTLVAADANEIIIHNASEQTGDIHIHFPRAGFELKSADH